ncbi:MAG: hypothetical protein WAN41_12235, partial [Candidatus Sulfotelmatobacter sp.]
DGYGRNIRSGNAQTLCVLNDWSVLMIAEVPRKFAALLFPLSPWGIANSPMVACNLRQAARRVPKMLPNNGVRLLRV